MDIKDIRRIIEMMKENELSEFELEDEGFRIAIKRSQGADPRVMVSSHVASPHMMSPHPPPMTIPVVPETSPVESKLSGDEALHKVTSPMVGTFYRSPTPDADPFVTVGSEVDDDSVICIVEAMKVMNEIKAETRGIIRKILVDNASPVQFGQPLFLVEPA